MEASSTRRRSSGSSSSAKATGKIVVPELEQDKDTKNAYRFQEVLPKGRERGVIGSIYVLKADLEKAGIDPELPIKVTVEQADE